MAKVKHPEFFLHCNCVAWFKIHYPQFCNSLVYINNNASSPARGAQNKKLGTLAGFPDICLFLSNAQYHGLLIEFKAVGKKPTARQLEIHATLISEGYKVEVITGIAQFRSVIKEYLKIF